MKLKCVRHRYTLTEAVALYVGILIAVTLLSLATGLLAAALLQQGDQAIFIMRSINGAVTLWLMHRVLSKKDYAYCIILPASIVSAIISACGYEIIGLLLVSLATMLPVNAAATPQRSATN